MSALETIWKVESAPQLQGTPSSEALRRILRLYHGPKGAFVYEAFQWLSPLVWDNRLPVPLMQWALTAYGGCLGLTHPIQEYPPVITLHPAIWRRTPGSESTKGWAARIPCGPRYTLDVVIHELVHVEVAYLEGGWSGARSPHDNPKWCAAIERVAERFKGTMLELPPFQAQPTKRIRVDGSQLRRPPAGCLSMEQCSHWPHSIREPSYYRAQSVPFELGVVKEAAGEHE